MSEAGGLRRRQRLALPAGFARIERPGDIALVDPDWRVPLEAAGLLDPRRVRMRLAEARGRPRATPRGRAPIAVVAVAGRGERIALRGLQRGGWLGTLLGARLVGPGRPFRELDTTARLHGVGAPVPRPVFALAWQRGLAWNAAIGTVFVEHAIDAGAWLARGPSRDRLHAGLHAAGQALRRFHDAGGSHPDLHVGNLLVRETSGTPEILVIDLDLAHVGAAPSPARRLRQLMRLHRSLHKRGLLAAAGADRGSLRVLHAYVAGDRELRRALLAHLPRERRRLARHALLYRRHGERLRTVS